MSEPECPQKAPYGVDLEPGSYWWCSCGRSKNQPFCDGSHQGTEFSPVEVKVEKPGKVWLCGCKRSANGALCDGTHNKL